MDLFATHHLSSNQKVFVRVYLFLLAFFVFPTIPTTASPCSKKRWGFYEKWGTRQGEGKINGPEQCLTESVDGNTSVCAVHICKRPVGEFAPVGLFSPRPLNVFFPKLFAEAQERTEHGTSHNKNKFWSLGQAHCVDHITSIIATQ